MQNNTAVEAAIRAIRAMLTDGNSGTLCAGEGDEVEKEAVGVAVGGGVGEFVGLVVGLCVGGAVGIGVGVAAGTLTEINVAVEFVTAPVPSVNWRIKLQLPAVVLLRVIKVKLG